MPDGNTASQQAFAPDLTSCDREPIHRPGSIQPHGALLVLADPDMQVCVASENVAAHFGRDARSLLALPMRAIFDSNSVAAITTAASETAAGQLPRIVEVRTTIASGRRWRATAHRSENRVLLEIEANRPPRTVALGDFIADHDAATVRLQGADGTEAICQCLAEEIRRLTGFDRVMIYRFSADWHGEVIAEANGDRLSSFLGLHFPASDIPVQARALYARHPERLIPDVGYTPVALIGDGADMLDLSAVALRSVSPIHIEYLRNMQVAGSMSISIMRDGALWGLVACHHHAPRWVAPEVRQAGVLLAKVAAWQIGVAENTDIVRRSAGVHAIEALLLKQTTSGYGYRDGLLAHGNEVLELLDATGFALSHGATVTTFGRTPPEDAMRELLEWLSEHRERCFETDHLAAEYPPAQQWSDIAGVLAVSLGGSARNMMIWFRPPITRTVRWGGNPAKPLLAGSGRLTPRTSFAAWTELVSGRSNPWRRHEIVSANGLRSMIVEIILRRSSELEQINLQLARSNEELEAFAYVASHDLKEPLRQIETFGTLLERAFRVRTGIAADVQRWFDGIRSSSRRLRTLIDDLTEYSRIGRHASPFAPAPLGELLDTVRSDLTRLIEENRAQVNAGTLPTIMCDQTQIRQVLQNIITNAIKYRHPDRPPVIEVSARIDGHGADPSETRPSVTIAIADNGIGIDRRHTRRIFEPFQRLHSADQYEGSGIGLAICRKIIERHQGSIDVVSEPDRGSTFVITLPLRALPGDGDAP